MAISTCVDESGKPIVLYDLRYALRIDITDPAQVNMAWDHCHAVATLQGIVNRESPALYVLFVEHQWLPGINVDQYWLDIYRRPDEWLSLRPLATGAWGPRYDIVDLIETFRDHIKGVVLYDPNVPATSNVASAVAGVEDLVAVRYDPTPGSLYSRIVLHGPELPIGVRLVNEDATSMFTGTGIIPETDRPSTGSAKCDAHLWLKHTYMDTGRCSGTHGAYYVDYCWVRDPMSGQNINHHCLTNHDYFVSHKAFFFDLCPWHDEPASDDPDQEPGLDFRTMCELLRSAYEHGGREDMIHIGGFPFWGGKYTRAGSAKDRTKHGAVETEWEYARVISNFNGFKDADAISIGAMANASFWQHFPLEDEYPQQWASHDALQRRGYLTPDGRLDLRGRRFLLSFIGDYDAASWLTHNIPHVWDDPARGTLPLWWCINPNLADRAPMAMHYIRKTATNHDYFSAADNGAGYLNPLHLQEPREISGLPDGLTAWRRHCRKHYKRWGYTVTGWMIDGFAGPMSPAVLDCYAEFGPNGIAPVKGPLSLLHGNLPVLRAGIDQEISQDPREAASEIREAFANTPVPFVWTRTVSRTARWQKEFHDALRTLDSTIEWVDAPTFWELYRRYLKSTPDAATGTLKNEAEKQGGTSYRNWMSGDEWT